MGKWNILDKTLAKMRANQIMKFIPPKAIVCDIGCGKNFDLLKSLSDEIKEGVGIDKSVSNGKWKNISLIQHDIEKGLPLKDEFCDVVVMLAVVEHLNAPEKVLKEVYRILKRGGLLLLTTPSPISKPILETAAHLHILSAEDIFDHKRYFSKNEIIGVLKKVGFKEIDFSYFQFGFNQRVVAKK